MGALGTDPRVGSELAGYRVEALVGRGGMGVVYRAYDLALERPVALKILAPELAADARFRERFLRESRLAASIDHPNIVPVYDAGEVGGELYLAMRYVQGADLRQLLADGPLAPSRGVALATQVAAALDAAHARGLVHRDVKPSNVLVTADDHVYLADFGLTRRLADQAAGFDAGLSLGTPAYVAPEQIEGKDIDGRADQYSLACLLHEALIGQPPFPRATDLATLYAHLEEPPPTPPGLEHVLPKALAKNPEARYRTCSELVQEASRALAARGGRRRTLWMGAPVLAVALGLAAWLPLTLTGGASGPSARPVLAVKTDSIQRIDPKTNKLVATIAVPAQSPMLAVGGGSVWAASAGGDTVFVVDPARNRVTERIGLGEVDALSFGAGHLWVLNARDGLVVAIDPITKTNVANVPLPPGAPGGSLPFPFRAGDDGVWVSWVTNEGNAVRVDPASTAAKVVQIGPPTVQQIDDFATDGRGRLWAYANHHPANPNGEGAVLAVDPGHAAKVRVVAPAAAGPVYGSMAADATGVWVTDPQRDVVSHVDSAGARARRIRVGDFPAAITLDSVAAWVLDAGDHTVSRVDPATDRVVATIRVRAQAGGDVGGSLAAGAGGIWVAVAPP